MKNEAHNGYPSLFKPTQLDVRYRNLSKKDLNDVNQRRVLSIGEFWKQPGLARIDDDVIYPQQVPPTRQQELQHTNRNAKFAGQVKQDYHFRYIWDRNRPPQRQELLGNVIYVWTANTCVTFERVDEPAENGRRGDGGCDEDAAPTAGRYFCVGNYSRSGCGAQPAGSWRLGLPVRRLSLDASCSRRGALRTLGQLTGRRAENRRPDRDRYRTVRYENIDASSADTELLHNWSQYFPCGGDAGLDAMRPVDAVPPFPFDYRSVMQATTSEHADVDQRPILVAKDVRFQALLDYQRKSYTGLSFFDRVSVMRLYGCGKKNLEQCKSNGLPVPKCKNFGFLWHDCACVCPPTHAGHQCRLKTGENLFPLEPNIRLLEVSSNRAIDFSDSDPSSPRLTSDARVRHVAIVARGGDGAQVVVEVVRRRPLTSYCRDGGVQSRWIGAAGALDCGRAVTLLWGVGPRPLGGDG